MTETHERVARALALLTSQTESIDAVAADAIHDLAHTLHIWVLLLSVDAAGMFARLDLLETLAQTVPGRRNQRVLREVAKAHAQRIAAFWQAFSDVCDALAENPPLTVDRAASGFLSTRVEEFQRQWPNVPIDSTAYQEHLDTLVSWWNHCVALDPASKSAIH